MLLSRREALVAPLMAWWPQRCPDNQGKRLFFEVQSNGNWWKIPFSSLKKGRTYFCLDVMDDEVIAVFQVIPTKPPVGEHGKMSVECESRLIYKQREDG